MAGAANTTTGNIINHAKNQDCSQCDRNEPVSRNGKLAIAAAIAQVKQDWITP